MKTLFFKMRLARILRNPEEWLGYSFLPNQRGPVPWGEMDHDAQLGYIQSCFVQKDTSANMPGSTRLDRRIQSLCRLYRGALPKQQALVRDSISRTVRFALHHFAWRMAVVALRERSQDALKLGLVALCIEDGRIDIRDTLGWLSLLYHAAERIRAPTDACFRDAAGASSERVNQVILAFLDRSPELKSIGAFGFREGSSKYGLTLHFSGR